MADFEPRILGFLCNWCSYAGADLAGVSRMQYPTNIRVVRVMCSGRVDPAVVADTLLKGLDGVLVTGCHINDCHYITGNFHTQKRMKLLIELIDQTPLRGRVKLEWVSASEGARFAAVVKDFTDNVRALGPTPVNSDPAARTALMAVRDTFSSPRLRNIMGKFLHLTEKGNVYGVKLDKDLMDRSLNDVVRSEHARALIINTAGTAPVTVPRLAQMTHIPTDEILRHLSVMMKQNIVSLTGHDGADPLFQVAPGAGVG
jgi:F420-non-reducing hydrogenase iron-sulfur subunit